MVRINFCTYIITLICFFQAEAAFTKKTLKNMSPASAYLEKIILESLVLKNDEEEEIYECDGTMQGIYSQDSEPTKCDDLKLTCKLFSKEKPLPDKIYAKVEHLFLTKYQAEKKSHYILDGINSSLKLGKMNLFAKNITTDTKDNQTKINDCHGAYQTEDKIIYFNTSDTINIKAPILLAKKLDIKYKDIQAKINKLKFEYNAQLGNHLLADSTTIYIDNFKFYLNHIEYQDKNGKIHGIKGIQDNQDPIQISSKEALIVNDQIQFNESIIIKTKFMKIEIEKSQQVENKLELRNIKLQAGKMNGFSQKGYFDINNKELVLDEGRIEWKN